MKTIGLSRKRSSIMNSLRVLLVSSSFCLLPSAFPQGSLTPPGAPAPTMKTLDQIEPRRPIDSTATPGDATSVFKITEPGSYYLTGNIAGVSGKHGIHITTANVTLDLMGFELVGVAGSLNGIHVDNVAASNSCAVRNGTVRNWGFNGLQVNAEGAHRIEDIRALSNGNHGILSPHYSEINGCVALANGVDGINSGRGSVTASTSNKNGGNGIDAYVVRRCKADGNGGHGIRSGNGEVAHSLAKDNGIAGIVVGSWAVITACGVSGNANDGIRLGNGSIAVDCASSFNNGVGISAQIGCRIARCTSWANDGGGIFAHTNSVIEHCVAYQNGTVAAPAPGIFATDGCTISHCTSRENKSDGIQANSATTLIGCVAEANQGSYGMAIGAGSLVSQCVARSNTSTEATSAGIAVGSSTLVVNCVSLTNTTTATPTASTGMGFSLSLASTIRHCLATGNAGDGIRAGGSDIVIESNTAAANGSSTGDGAGIHLTSGDCRVEGNNVIDNDRGIDVDGAGNFIVRNSASGNTSNYVLVAGNAVGAIVVTVASGVVNGTGPLASSLGSTDPWANFSY